MDNTLFLKDVIDKIKSTDSTFNAFINTPDINIPNCMSGKDHLVLLSAMKSDNMDISIGNSNIKSIPGSIMFMVYSKTYETGTARVSQIEDLCNIKESLSGGYGILLTRLNEYLYINTVSKAEVSPNQEIVKAYDLKCLFGVKINYYMLFKQ